MNCKVCNSAVALFYRGKLLGKFEVDYFKCSQCGFIQTEDPYWLKEAYSAAIADLDIGLLDRNVQFSELVEKIILAFYPHSKYYLDYGGGYGLFVRRMRDKGFSFYRDDIYCENIFAKHFDLKDAPVQKFDLVTAFEVFEHLNEPLADIGKMAGLGDTLLFSTILAPETKEAFDQWWYRAPLSGQHIAFYTMKALQIIATKFDKKLYSNGTNLHILSNIPIDEDKWMELFLSKKRRMLDKWIRKQNIMVKRKSLLEDDYKMIENLIRKNIK